MVMDIVLEKDGMGWFEWLPSQRHAGLFGSEVSLARVASLAGGHQIGPCLTAATGAWQHMVERKVFFRSAILAFEPVSPENILPGETDDLVRLMDIPVEPDDRRHRERPCDRADPMGVHRLHQLAFIEEYQDKGTLHRTDHQRTVILVEYQHPAVHA